MQVISSLQHATIVLSPEKKNIVKQQPALWKAYYCNMFFRILSKKVNVIISSY